MSLSDKIAAISAAYPTRRQYAKAYAEAHDCSYRTGVRHAERLPTFKDPDGVTRVAFDLTKKLLDQRADAALKATTKTKPSRGRPRRKLAPCLK